MLLASLILVESKPLIVDLVVVIKVIIVEHVRNVRRLRARILSSSTPIVVWRAMTNGANWRKVVQRGVERRIVGMTGSMRGMVA